MGRDIRGAGGGGGGGGGGLRTHDVREVIFSGARYIWREWTAAPAMGPSISVIENIFKFANDNAFARDPLPAQPFSSLDPINETGEDFVLERNFFLLAGSILLRNRRNNFERVEKRIINILKINATTCYIEVQKY